MADIIVVRHGQASFHSDNYDQLSDLGRRQSQKLGEHLSRLAVQPDLILTGDHKRQQQTGEEINRYLGLPQDAVLTIPGLREHKGPQVVQDNLRKYINTDRWVSDTYSHYIQDPVKNIDSYIKIYNYITHEWALGKIKSEYQSWHSFYQESAQSFSDTWDRYKDKKVVIVTSSGPAAISTAHIHGLGPIGGMKLSWQIQNSSATYIDRTRHGMILKYFNDVSHLEIEERTTV